MKKYIKIWYTTTVVLRRKFIAIISLLEKEKMRYVKSMTSASVRKTSIEIKCH